MNYVQMTNSPAFPDGLGKKGMTLRDYFAAAAMQGLIAADAHDGGCVKCGDKYIAPLAYEMADDMLKAREA
jgi:hypothetical protein